MKPRRSPLERFKRHSTAPVSLALTSFGVNKFICGGSHDLRFTIGQEGRNLKKSMYTQEVPATALGSGATLSGLSVNGAAVGAMTGAWRDAGCGADGLGAT
eukprot:COSAG02_NODE_2715_length_8175_cov_46.281451_1_plen_101_part_00